jgi:predicted RNA-binding protein associated with RNAse of E/G family
LSGSATEVRIHYRRLHRPEQTFVQQLVARDDDCVITLLESTPLNAPLHIDGRIALEPGAPAVWFTFEGAWHDVGRFHDAAGRFTGFYANILTPVEGMAGSVWHTTDLFLDIWIPADGGDAVLLDGDEAAAAEAAGQLSSELHTRACAEADRLLAEIRTGEWPPAIVRAWTLARARSAVAGT